jgi:hypothetical protein
VLKTTEIATRTHWTRCDPDRKPTTEIESAAAVPAREAGGHSGAIGVGAMDKLITITQAIFRPKNLRRIALK